MTSLQTKNSRLLEPVSDHLSINHAGKDLSLHRAIEYASGAMCWIADQLTTAGVKLHDTVAATTHC